mmetsp:Transcript_18751/g.44167  ORF Transcript_18751/g.44167 Transcript_18751/m.44167 type:complete len:274 (+) Transcript_18751:59-880(+)
MDPCFFARAAGCDEGTAIDLECSVGAGAGAGTRDMPFDLDWINPGPGAGTGAQDAPMPQAWSSPGPRTIPLTGLGLFGAPPVAATTATPAPSLFGGAATPASPAAGGAASFACATPAATAAGGDFRTPTAVTSAVPELFSGFESFGSLPAPATGGLLGGHASLPTLHSDAQESPDSRDTPYSPDSSTLRRTARRREHCARLLARASSPWTRRTHRTHRTHGTRRTRQTHGTSWTHRTHRTHHANNCGGGWARLKSLITMLFVMILIRIRVLII